MSKKTDDDPTGLASNRNKGTRLLQSKLSNAERRVKDVFSRVRRNSKRVTKIVNSEHTLVYEYDYGDAKRKETAALVEFIVNNELLDTQVGEMQSGWFWKGNIEPVYRRGAVEEVRDFNQMIVAAGVAGFMVFGMRPKVVPAQDVLLSDVYRKNLSANLEENFLAIKTIAQRTAAQVTREINTGIDAGQSPRVVVNKINDRFDVAKSSVKTASETQINEAYNNAKMDITELMGAKTGLRSGVLHKSALLTTTRPTHADRHGNAYSVADQRQWWDTGSNRINCKCTVTSVLIDNRGKLVFSEEQERLKAQGKSFFG